MIRQKGLILLGAVLIVVGLALLFFQKVPFPGKLPGDILLKRENFIPPPWPRA